MIRPYRSIYFNDERKWKVNNKWDDVYQVGLKKAIGYVPIDFNSDELFEIVYHFSKSNKLFLINSNLNSIKNPDRYTVWAGDKIMIQNIIDANLDIISKYKWPLDAEEFFNKICFENIRHKDNEELYHVINDLFNSWCLFCEIPIVAPNNFIHLSKNPYNPDKLEK